MKANISATMCVLLLFIFACKKQTNEPNPQQIINPIPEWIAGSWNIDSVNVNVKYVDEKSTNFITPDSLTAFEKSCFDTSLLNFSYNSTFCNKILFTNAHKIFFIETTIHDTCSGELEYSNSKLYFNVTDYNAFDWNHKRIGYPYLTESNFDTINNHIAIFSTSRFVLQTYSVSVGPCEGWLESTSIQKATFYLSKK